MSDSPLSERQVVELLSTARQRLFAEVGKVIVGQQHVVDEMLIALLAGGHCLITGAPGLAKTLLIKTVADVCHLSFQRIQFTPDLMPSDITGTEILEDSPEGGRALVFNRGPVFANM
ncbi:MAG: AAA family ATPase, partial [Verrucomicrobiaceae bacterium]|nr:AAA family ATPase [Verrucomicrobiaceae bacterium]